MSQKGLIYSFEAKGTAVLAEHTSYLGKFSTIAVQCLQKLPSSSSKYTYSCDGHTIFSLLLMNPLEELYLSFSILYRSRLKEHMQYCITQPEETSKLSKLEAQITKVKGIMMDNIEKCHCCRFWTVGERIELLVDKTDNLQFQGNKAPHFRVLFDKFLHIHDGLRIFFQADIFQRQGRQLRRKMWFQNIQMKLIGGAVVVIILLFWLISRAGGK